MISYYPLLLTLLAARDANTEISRLLSDPANEVHAANTLQAQLLYHCQKYDLMHVYAAQTFDECRCFSGVLSALEPALRRVVPFPTLSSSSPQHKRSLYSEIAELQAALDAKSPLQLGDGTMVQLSDSDQGATDILLQDLTDRLLTITSILDAYAEIGRKDLQLANITPLK